MGKNNTPYIVSFYKQQKNKKKGIKVVLQEDWYPVATGYVYKWTFELDGKTWYYIGYHSIKIDEKKFYDFSSEVVEMRDLYSNEKCQKTVEVLHWGTAEQMKKKEEELLEDVKHRFWNKPGGDYFNQKIQYLSGNQISGVNLSTVEQVNKELEILKDRRTDKYSELKKQQSYSLNEDWNIQYYKPNGGFKKWHCENNYYDNVSSRILVFQTFLNDVDEGGTEFLYQNQLVNAKKGLTLIWPAYWTHTHKGQISSKNEKYIATGWFSDDKLYSRKEVNFFDSLTKNNPNVKVQVFNE